MASVGGNRGGVGVWSGVRRGPGPFILPTAGLWNHPVAVWSFAAPVSGTLPDMGQAIRCHSQRGLVPAFPQEQREGLG